MCDYTANSDKDLIVKVQIEVNAPIERVWDALTNPKAIKKYMLGADAVSEWREGSSIVWRGEWNGKKYEDKGKILKLVPERLIRYSHFSPLTGLPDAPESYHIVTVELASSGARTLVSLSQTNNPTQEALQHNEQGWKMMLDGLKKYLEQSRP
ncbi:MAG: SRPBCC domain-containing protein [Candidatus Micrarchaeota archaeon]|nr:SRPBCC domain-containing protein [Candidatus Micrarchaeota archaeon]